MSGDAVVAEHIVAASNGVCGEGVEMKKMDVSGKGCSFVIGLRLFFWLCGYCKDVIW